MDFGVICEVQLATNVTFLSKKWVQKTSWKKVPPKSETGGDGHVPGLPDSPAKVKDCLSNKQQLNKATTINNNSTTTPTIAESLLQFDCCCVCFLFDFYFKLMFCLGLVRFLNVDAELMIQSKGPWSDTPWARPGEFQAYSKHMPSLFQVLSRHIPSLFQTYSKHMPSILQAYATRNTSR